MQSGLEHASEDAMERYSMGTLPLNEAVVLEEHLLVCPDCQDRLVEIDAYVRAVRHAAAEIRRSEAGGRRISWLGIGAWPKAAWAAVGIAAMAAVLWFSATATLLRPVSQAPLAVGLRTLRGETPGGAVAPEGRALRLEADVAAMRLPKELEAQVVDRSGRLVARSAVQASGERVTVPLPGGLSRGLYWVRLIRPGPAQEVLREYSLRVE